MVGGKYGDEAWAILSARSERWREGVGCRTFVCRRPARSLESTPCDERRSNRIVAQPFI